MMKCKQIGVRVTPKQYDKLKQVASREGKTISDLLRLTIIETLKYE